LANQLAKDYKLKIIIYTWGIHNKVDWGNWDERIHIRIVPYSRYFQKSIAKIFYYIWIKKDNPDNYIINFLYHGESILSSSANIYYVLHSPASLIPHRYEYIQEKANKFNQLSFIAVSEAVKEGARPYFNKIPVNVIHHGIDLDRFNSTTHNINKEKLKLLSVSALEEWKGIQDIIKILAHEDLKHKFEYYVFGDGPYKKELEKIIKELDLSSSVRLKDSVNNIESIFPNYDVYCQLSDGEAFGLSLFEAMACGLPSIVYDIPPFDTLFPKNSVVKLKNRSQLELKDNLLQLTDKNKRDKLGKTGRIFVRENFSIEKMGECYFNLLMEQKN
jgi:glycosyltransferase involved in cell wall biosynthesis